MVLVGSMLDSVLWVCCWCVPYICLWLCSMGWSVEATATFSSSLFSPSDHTSKCPPDALKHAMTCTAKLQPLSLSGSLLNENGAVNKALENGCTEGDFFDALNCIERVMLDCRHDKSNDAHFLRMTMDVANTRKSIVYFCSNLKTYTSNLDCMKDSMSTIGECGQEAKAKLMAQMTATSNVDALMRFQCPFYNKAVTCAKDELKSKCGQELSQFVYTVLVGLEPPVCSKSIYSISAGRQQDEQYSGGGGGVSGAGRICSNVSLLGVVVFVVLLSKANVRW